jgi:hypothetical protein
MKPAIKVYFEDFWHPNTPEAIKKNPLYILLSSRFELVLSDDPDFLIYSFAGFNHLKYNCIRIFYTGENIRPDFNVCDYAFSCDYPITEKNYRLPLYKLYDEYPLLFNRNNRGVVTNGRKFCSFVYSNDRAKERIYFFHMLEKYKPIDAGGRSMNNIGFFVEDKLEFLRNYKFTIAFENSSYPGYTTEKIIHAFIANTIPIYWGNPLITKDFNPKAFINCHDFASFEDVVKKVINVDMNDDLYREYLRQPPFINNIENEFANTNNILQRFEQIFTNKKTQPVAKKSDILKYSFYLLKKRLKCVTKEICTKFHI